MIPAWDLEIRGDLTFRTVSAPDADAALAGIGITNDYEPLLTYAWRDVEDVLPLESEWIRKADQESRDALEFEEHATIQLEQGGYTDEDGGEAALYFAETFDCIEGGVVSLVRALCSAGFMTISSCRGHADYRNRCPQVSLLGEAARLALLGPLIRLAGCGADSGSTGELWVYAPSVDRMIGLADRMLREKAAFDALGAPVWKAEAIARLDELEN